MKKSYYKTTKINWKTCIGLYVISYMYTTYMYKCAHNRIIIHRRDNSYSRADARCEWYKWHSIVNE